MSTTKLQSKLLVGGLLAFVLLAGVAVGASTPKALADGVVFLTRVGQVASTYPRTNAFSIGSTTSQGQIATTTIGKLNVTINPSDTYLGASLREGYKTAFEVASTSTSGGTATTSAELLKVNNSGCIQVVSTSTSGTATPIKLMFSALGATSTFSGTTYWNFGTCP